MTRTYMHRLWEPWTESGIMSRLSDRDMRPGSCEYPAVNVWMAGDEAELTAEIPGIDRESIDITVSVDTVTLQGKRPEENHGDNDTYYRHELRYGDFCKSIRLPFTIDSEKVKATYRNGVLKIELRQVASEKPRSIKILSE